jgi:predicted nuclease of predicted toxin-antitoxin system
MQPPAHRMRLLFDQGVPQAAADLFIARGHEVIYSRDVLQQDSPDQLIAYTAATEGWIVVANDKDYRRFNALLPQGFR